MEVSEVKRKGKNADAMAMEGRQKLSDAIHSQSMGGFMEALAFLSTTSQASLVPTNPSSEETTTTTTTKTLRIDIDFDVRYPAHQLARFNRPRKGILHACIGLPASVGAQMVRCLLTPQILRSGDNLETTIIVTNASNNKRVLEASHDFDRPSPLTMACIYENIEIVELLLEHGADPDSGYPNPNRNPTNGGEWIPPLYIGSTLNNLPFAKLLLDYGANPNIHGDLLYRPCSDGNLHLMKLLLEHGADPNACGNDGITPLIRASRLGKLDMVKLLLMPADKNNNNQEEDENNDCRKTGESSFHENKWGTDVYHYDQQSMNALMHACAENEEDVALFLASGGGETINNNKSDSESVARFVNDYRVDPALWYASAHGSTTIVKFLMDDCFAKASYRKNPNVYSSTPLEEASQWGHTSTAKVLLGRSGSDPRSRAGQKARAQAERSGHCEVVLLLDVWKERMELIEKGSFPLGLLPLLLSRRADTAHRILCNHADGLCCHRHFINHKRICASRKATNAAEKYY